MVQALIDNGMYSQAYQAIQPMLVRVAQSRKLLRMVDTRRSARRVSLIPWRGGGTRTRRITAIDVGEVSLTAGASIENLIGVVLGERITASADADGAHRRHGRWTHSPPRLARLAAPY